MWKKGLWGTKDKSSGDMEVPDDIEVGLRKHLKKAAQTIVNSSWCFVGWDTSHVT